MVSDGLREVLERGHGVGEFDEPDARTGTAEHPICGDHVELSVRCDEARLLGVRWRAAGCPAVTAVAALCAEVLGDVARADYEQVLRDAIAAHGGLATHERHAEAMVLRALRSAVAG